MPHDETPTRPLTGPVREPTTEPPTERPAGPSPHGRAPFPRGMLSAGAIQARLLATGLPMGPMHLLHTLGRRSGRTHTVPVVLYRHGGAEWLVSPFGEVAWVHNVRAAGRAVLEAGRRERPVDLIEVTDDRRPAVLRGYRRAFRVVPFVRAAFAHTSLHDDAALAAQAHRHPVFLVTGEGR